jgi:hypothetical protein
VATEAALACARDDAHAAVERQGSELGTSLAALTERRVGELKVRRGSSCTRREP